MRRIICYKTIVPILTTLFSLLSLDVIGQSLKKHILVDTLELTFSYDSSFVKLNKSIINKDYWIDILRQDTTLITYFKNRGNNNPYYVYVASIEKAGPFTFEFMIYSRPVDVEPKNLSGYGYAIYYIILAPLLDGKHRISEVRFNGIIT